MIDSNQKEIKEKPPELESGVDQPPFLNQLTGMLQTVTVAPTLPPRWIGDQIQISLIAGTYKLNIWDNTNQVWKSVTIT